MKKKKVNSAHKYYLDTQCYAISNALYVAVMFYNRSQKQALDLGCGSLRDTKFLINSGFIVTAIDKHPAVKKFTKWTKFLPKGIFHLKIKKVQDTRFKKKFYDIVNAQNFFSFNSKEDVKKIIKRVHSALKPSGIFTGNFYGVNDSFVKGAKIMKFYTFKEVEGLLYGFKIIHLNQYEKDSKDADGKFRHCHFIEFIVQKSG